jgi:hypothetical protein
VLSRNASVKAVISIGSPSGVAVPCASINVIVSGSTPAISCASRITDAWPVALGAVYPIRSAPSLLIAVPRMTAWM